MTRADSVTVSKSDNEGFYIEFPPLSIKDLYASSSNIYSKFFRKNTQ